MKVYDAIIVGAGPAGLTCALYLRRANKSVLVIEAKSYGGQIVNASKVENYPAILEISGFDFANNLYNQVKKLGAEIIFEEVVKIAEDKIVTTNKNTYKAKTVVIASGSINRKLNLPNEEELTGKGVSYCATCDGNFYKDKVVAVNGGGNTALEDALYLAAIASKVYLIHRRAQFRGESRYLEELKKKKNVEFILNANIIALQGSDKLDGIVIENNLKERTTLKIAGLFIAIGQEPQNERFKNVVDLDEKGYIVTQNEIYTKTDGIYAIGDARVKSLRQLTTATADGSIAASAIIQKLN